MIRTMSMKLMKLLGVVVFFLVVMMPTAQAEYTPITCQYDNPCKNGGTCARNGSLQICSCKFGWNGSSCTVPWCKTYDSGGQCIVDLSDIHRFASTVLPVVVIPVQVTPTTSAPSPSTITISVIALIGLIGLRWSRRKR
jgi:hypothetical protein